VIDPDALNVWFEDRLVGYLWRNPIGAIGFRYEPEWINTGGFAVSLTLPLAAEDFSAEDSVAHRFFANLLPEGGVRGHIVRDLKISNSDFDLLRAIGGECAGAISILSVEREPSEDRSYRPLPDEELARLVARRGQIYAAWPEDKRPRLSLAGAQDKCPVLIRDGHYFLPEGEAPSSHILKFELTDYRHLPAYETFTSYLAKQIGLPVVNIELHTIEKRFYAQIERYDRVWDERGEVQRLHQEDFCQALGYGYEKKYQDSGGPTFADCCIYKTARFVCLPSMIWFVRAPSNASITISPLLSAGKETPGGFPQNTGIRLLNNAMWEHASCADCYKRLRPPYWNKSVKQRRCSKHSTVIIQRCSASSVLSHSNATVPPEFKTASVLDALKNPDQDWANRASAPSR
jgi:HipA-like protein